MNYIIYYFVLKLWWTEQKPEFITEYLNSVQLINTLTAEPFFSRRNCCAADELTRHEGPATQCH